jgi:hypothetical protein
MNARPFTGFTLVEMMMLCVAGAVTLALLCPVVHHLRSSSGEATSMMNLANLGAMHGMYAADWSDRQYTAIPDDLGVYSTSPIAATVCSSYVSATGCYPSAYIGLVESGVGFYVYIAPCPKELLFGDCNGAAYGWPYHFSTISVLSNIAMFRIVNLAALNAYADGRWYDEVYYSPTDVKAYASAQPNFDDSAQMNTNPNPPIFSSYCSSAAAMFHPDVFTPATRRGPAWRFTFADRFKSPTVSECLFPDLKTRMLEHNWNQNPPAEFNPAVSGGVTPYQFNHGLDSSPITLFFDGHVDFLSIAAAVADDITVMRQTRSSNGLWSRDTLLGPNGYKGEISFDGTLSGVHMLTLGGITGRDVLTAP